jgi:Domain of unknown function (DUF4397)
MRRFILLSTLCLAAGVVSACKPEEAITSPAEPTAGVRFINAVPDTGGANGLDFRFIDKVENSSAYNVPFRSLTQTSGSGATQVIASALIQFKGAQVGARHFRIFLSDTLQSIATVVLKDSTLTLEANHNYTVLLWGNARSTNAADRMRLTVIDETVADPAASVALRVINATTAPIDVRQYASTGTLPATATWANLAGLSISNYQQAAPSQIRFNVQPAGGGTALFNDVLALIGQPIGTQTGGCTVGLDCDVTPGTTVPGSAVTLIVFPRSVAGSKATNFANPGSSFMWDRRPPRACTVSFGC